MGGKKQNKVYFVKIKTIQSIFTYNNYFPSHFHQKKHLLQSPSPANYQKKKKEKQ